MPRNKADDLASQKSLANLKGMMAEIAQLQSESDALRDKMRAELRRHEEDYPQNIDRPKRQPPRNPLSRKK